MTEVVHGVASLVQKSGGTAAYVAHLGSEQARQNTGVTLFTPFTDEQDLAIAPSVKRLSLPQEKRFVCSRAYQSRFEHFGDGISAVGHGHGLWLPVNHHFQAAIQKKNIPFVLSPHGMLEPYALKMSAMKKRVAWFLYQKRDIDRADCLHATAVQEAENLRELGIKQSIIISPPGIQLPEENSMKEWGKEPSKIALFLSRIHPKKNLLGLVRAWAKVKPPGWKLLIAGPDEQNHVSELQKEIQKLGLNEEIEVQGPVYGDEEKAKLYCSASLFVLPSFSENFGIVVPEALSYGVPVIATTPTPWEELETHGCGWWVKPDESELAAALDDATSQSIDALQERGRNGRRLVEAKYQWPAIASEMNEAYRWILGERSKPSNVV